MSEFDAHICMFLLTVDFISWIIISYIVFVILETNSDTLSRIINRLLQNLRYALGNVPFIDLLAIQIGFKGNLQFLIVLLHMLLKQKREELLDRDLYEESKVINVLLMLQGTVC